MSEVTPNVPAQRGDSPFDAIRRVDEQGEHWSARELMPLLGYGPEWRNFAAVIERAKITAQNSGSDPDEQFSQVTQLVDANNLGMQTRQDYRLTRYGAYLVAMNGDPRKTEIAAAQTYFAVKTREAEVAASGPVDELDIVQAMLDQLRGTREVARRAETMAITANEGVRVASARLDAIEGRHGWYTALSYAKLNGHRTEKNYLLRVGRVAGEIGRARNISPGAVPNDQYGSVNSWPDDVWVEAFTRVGPA